MREYFYQRDRKINEYCNNCEESSERFYVESERNYETKEVKDYHTPCRQCYPDDFRREWLWRTQNLGKDQKRKSYAAAMGFEYGAPDNFKDIDLMYLFENNTNTATKIENMIDAYLYGGENKNYAFYGKAGTGKTFSAFAFCNAIQYELHYPKYVTHSLLKKSILKSYNDKNDFQVLNHYINASVLFIDEFGSIEQKENDKAWFFDIIDGRYQKKLPTVLIINTENNSSSKLRDEIGFRAFDRLRCNLEWIEFAGDSLR